MTVPLIELANSDLAVLVDPGRGADVVSLVDRHTGADLLFSSPWRARADAVRAGQRPATFDPVAGWLEQYRGGWQTLCPSAGDPRTVHGAPVAFHGEASVVPWVVDEVTATTLSLHVELFLVPVLIRRTIALEGRGFQQVDTLSNLSDTTLEFDYSSHPAFGNAFLDGGCRIETGARRFTADPSSASILPPGSEHSWPWAVTESGRRIDLREVPAPGCPRSLFGWLDDFSGSWASVTSRQHGVGARLEWDGAHLPHAWLWQELNGIQEFPWYGRARAVAIEPSSTQTSGPARRSALRLEGASALDIPITLTLEGGTS
jgi:hypothetical protein